MNRNKCYNEQLVCPRQIDDKPCDCEWLPENIAREEVRELALLTDEEIEQALQKSPVEGNRLEFDALPFVAKAQLDKLLDLCYPCKDCEGSGKREVPPVMGYEGLISQLDCPTCQGTGQGEKMIAILDENQESPGIPSFQYDKEEDGKLLRRGAINYSKMLTKWRKIL